MSEKILLLLFTLCNFQVNLPQTEVFIQSSEDEGRAQSLHHLVL